MPPLRTLAIPKPDDWHLHLRDGAILKAVLPHTARDFARAIIMPNLKPAVTTAGAARAYRQRIREALAEGETFTPLMTVYLTDTTEPDDLERGYRDESLFAAKLYPAGTTTNSAEGVTDIQAISSVLDRMQTIGMPLLLHGEVADPDIDFFDREEAFIDRVLIPMRRTFPDLKIVMEHVSTCRAVEYIVSEAQNRPDKIAATITPHHMLLNRNALFEGGINPHHFCLPVLKREKDRQAVLMAATTGAPMFFAGTDSAPHPRASKEAARGNGGVFSAPNALAVYAELFEQAGALDRLENFLCINGASFYGLPINAATLTLEKLDNPVPSLKSILTEDGQEIMVFPDESALSWRVAEKTPL